VKPFTNSPFSRFPSTCQLFGIIPLATCLVATLHAAELEYRLAAWWKPELISIDQRLASIHKEIQGLPRMPDMDARGTHGFHSDFTLDSESNWLRIDWLEPRKIDAVALIPTRLTTQSGEMSNYGLPHRLRIEAGLPGQDEPVVLAEVSDTRLATRRGEPLFIEFPPTQVHWLRFVPVDLPTLPGKSVRFFSAAEALVFEGESNIAPQGKLSANFSIDAETGLPTMGGGYATEKTLSLVAEGTANGLKRDFPVSIGASVRGFRVASWEEHNGFVVIECR
jgi:hypothetical protein